MVGQKLIMKKEGNEISREISPIINIKLEGNKITLSSKRIRRIEKKIFGTMKAHINNMIKGLTEGFEYKFGC